MRLRLALVVIGTTVAPHVMAIDLQCYEQPGTLLNTCIAPSLTTSSGDLRSSPVYMGGPKSINRAAFSAIADCKKKALVLQNPDGQNFSGGAASSTPASSVLFKALCEVKNPKADKTIRMF